MISNNMMGIYIGIALIILSLLGIKRTIKLISLAKKQNKKKLADILLITSLIFGIITFMCGMKLVILSVIL